MLVMYPGYNCVYTDWLMQLVKQESAIFEEFSDELATLRKKDMDASISKHEEVKRIPDFACS